MKSRTADLAVLAAALALGGVTLAAWGRWSAARAAETARAEAAAGAERLGALLQTALATARLRAEALAALPAVRAAVESDAVTARDLLRAEGLEAAAPGETIELFEGAARRARSLARLPAEARPIDASAWLGARGTQQRVESDGDALRVVAAAPVSPPHARGLRGAIATATRLLLSSFALPRRAELVGLDEPLALGGRAPLDGERVVAVALPLPAGAQPRTLSLRAAVQPAGATPLWSGRLLLLAALLAALLAVVEHRRPRRLDDATTRRHLTPRQANAPRAPLTSVTTIRGKLHRHAAAAPNFGMNVHSEIDEATPIPALQPQRESVPLVIDPRGERLHGRYELLSLLGRGHNGAVYLAQSLVAGAPSTVALKLLDDGAPRDAFLATARQQARLRHPNVVRVFHVGDGDPAYVAMEYVEGCTLELLLRDLFARAAPLPTAQTVAIVAAICRALDAARPLVHGALKPANVLVARRNLVKLSDFGAPPSPTDRHAPEQHAGKRADRRTDVYAVGLILHELLTARREPLVPGDAGRWPPLPAPSSLRAEVPRALDAVVQKATRFGPRARYKDAAELLDELMRATGDETPALSSAWLGDWVDRARRWS